MNFENKIMPFFWTEHEEMASVCLNVGEYCKDVFEIRASEGFLGNGYDWESLATVFLEEKTQNLIEEIQFDSEAGMFCVYSENKEALKKFVLEFKKACEDKKLIKDLFSRAELI